MRNLIVLYLPYEIESFEKNKGSSVRINNMIKAFKEYYNKSFYQFVLIKGSQKQRYQKITNIDFKSIKYIYIELPNIPLLLSNSNHIPDKPFVDYYLLNNAKKNNVPISGFLRDIYWKFDDMYPLKGVKKYFMSALHEKYLDLFSKYFDVLFVPSLTMSSYLDQNFKKNYGITTRRKFD